VNTPELVTMILERPSAVIGAGTQGRRVALMLASQGGEVRVFARSAASREAALAFVSENLPAVAERVAGSPGRIVLCTEPARAADGAGLVVEAVPERPDLKRAVLGELDRLAPPDAVLCSNSSSYPTSQLIDEVARPERVVNTHFYMPPIQTAVEIMSCGRTDPAVIPALLEVLPRFGLDPYHVRTESIGFIFNRVWAAIKREALAVVAEGVATPEDVDRIFRANLGSTEAPFRLMDKVGLDVVLDIEERYAAARPGVPEGPRRLLSGYVTRGDLGTKSGRGFYSDYT
jgi:3-hydroxybutyryl-CoA dehydrogenase